jgi:hypothetical protein
MSQMIEGQWEELIKRRNLLGHKARVIVLDDETTPFNPQEWIKKL